MAPQQASAVAGERRVEVAVLHWPADVEVRAQLEAVGMPRLLVLDPGAAPPSGCSTLEDWVRSDAPGADRAARSEALARAWHRTGLVGPPVLSADGSLTYAGRTVELGGSSTLLRRLLRSFGQVVPLSGLRSGDPDRQWACRAELVALGAAVGPLGLRVRILAPAGAILETTALVGCEDCERIDDRLALPSLGDPR